MTEKTTTHTTKETVEDDRNERATPTMAEVDHAGTADVSGAFERGPVREDETE